MTTPTRPTGRHETNRVETLWTTADGYRLTRKVNRLVCTMPDGYRCRTGYTLLTVWGPSGRAVGSPDHESEAVAVADADRAERRAE